MGVASAKLCRWIASVEDAAELLRTSREVPECSNESHFKPVGLLVRSQWDRVDLHFNV